MKIDKKLLHDRLIHALDLFHWSREMTFIIECFMVEAINSAMWQMLVFGEWMELSEMYMFDNKSIYRESLQITDTYEKTIVHSISANGFAEVEQSKRVSLPQKSNIRPVTEDDVYDCLVDMILYFFTRLSISPENRLIFKLLIEKRKTMK